jgi:glycosyltransferase involved in cell wall biosynthesis
LGNHSLTVVIPVYNEERAFAQNFEVILRHLDAVQEATFNFLIVDDGSKDRTIDVVNTFCTTRHDVRLICLSRNFGKEAAIHAGIAHASGDAVIVMDSDLQHPPELIPRMLQLWRNGASIVEAYKVSRGRESLLSRVLANGFYRIFSSLAGMDLRNHSDFKLLDRQVADAYVALPERSRFFRGIVRWLGFSAVQIPFEVQERKHGSSAWSRLRLFRLSLVAITSFSAEPLQFVTLFGVLTFIISGIFGGIAIYHKFSGQAITGFTTVILLILIIGSILMISLGLVGMYIARIYDEVKGRPSYIIKRTKTDC